MPKHESMDSFKICLENAADRYWAENEKEMMQEFSRLQHAKGLETEALKALVKEEWQQIMDAAILRILKEKHRRSGLSCRLIILRLYFEITPLIRKAVRDRLKQEAQDMQC